PPPPSAPTLFPYTTLFRSSYSDSVGSFPSWRHNRLSFYRIARSGSRLFLSLPNYCFAHFGCAVVIYLDLENLAGDLSVVGNSGRSEEHTSELQSPCNLVCR